MKGIIGMNLNRRNRAFSLTEVLMAAGILVVGFLLIAGTFPVGIKLTALSTERTIGVVAAEEAMAKIHLFGKDPNTMPYDRHVPYDGESISQYMELPVGIKSSFILPEALNRLKINYPGIDTINAAVGYSERLERYFQCQSLYPSVAEFDYSTPANPQIKIDLQDPPRYFWSALCRRLDSSSAETQVTIFVCRMAGTKATTYPRFDFNRPTGSLIANPWKTSSYPTPVPVMLQTIGNAILQTKPNNQNVPVPDTTASPYYYSTLSLDDSYTPQVRTIMGQYLSEGSILLDDFNGRIMRVLEVVQPDLDNAADLGRIRLIRMPDCDGDSRTIEPADMEGLLRVERTGAPSAVYDRRVWVIPPAQATTTAGGNTPPKVAGRNPCVGVFQGQL
jgi:hypothetical protein